MMFLTAVGALCVICGILALLLTVADRYLNDYGTCAITINGGERVLEVPGGSTVLSSLGLNNIFIPSACGGGSSCGLCKLRIHVGGGPVLATEEPHLSAEERRVNVRLSCQVKVRNDMRIEIPDEYFKVKKYRGRVQAIQDLTHDIKLLRLKLLDPRMIDFTPGAYVQLAAPAYGNNPDPVYRAYSLASSPDDSGHIELIIRLVPGGICTTWVFEHLLIGQEISFNGPHGDFRLQDTDADMIFIAGGSGMAPFRSMLQHMKAHGPARTCTYFFGAVQARDMFQLDEMAALEQALPDFRFVPALSAPLAEDDWQGETGLITDVVDRHFPECSDKEAYLCGSPGMIDACIKVLTKNGMPEENVFYDKFA